MLATPLKSFIHPKKVYRLEYPAHWDNLQQDEARSCGFGPHERDDVGLWISIMPMSLDSAKIKGDLFKMMQQTLDKCNAANMREDKSLHHYGLKADMTKEGEGGHYWILTGGDVVIFASTQVPVAEKEEWNPTFEKLMASLRITRDDELILQRVAGQVLTELRKRHPEEDFVFDEKGITGKHQTVFLSNLYKEVLESPKRRDVIVKNFVENLVLSSEAHMGEEVWEECRGFIIPVLKPKDYLKSEGPTRHLLTSDWLADVVICYVIKSKKFFRFVTGWDVDRWGTTVPELQQIALENLSKLPWPDRMEGSRQQDGGRMILLDTPDNIASSRILHPEFHRLFSGPLGSPFYVGIPDRNTLVAFSNRRNLKKRITRTLKKDHDKSAYPITPRAFLVTADGIALAND